MTRVSVLVIATASLLACSARLDTGVDERRTVAHDAPPVSAPLPGAPSSALQSEWVHAGDDGKLEYRVTKGGNRIPDFSMAGYGGGGVPLPSVETTLIIASQSSGDDTARIQAALDEVAQRQPDAEGFRGAVLLRRGEYRISGQLRIAQSGVVLRGEGHGADGTVLVATGSDRRSLLLVSGQGERREVPGSRQVVLDGYVPVGADALRVADTSGFVPGDRVMVVRPSTEAWIDRIGMDACDSRGTERDLEDVRGKTCLDNAWTPGSKDLAWDRVVTEVEDDRIRLDAPITTALSGSFGGGYLYKYELQGRISQVGVESLRGVSEFSGPEDEEHSWKMIEVRKVEDAWVRDIAAYHFAYAAVSLEDASRRVTVQDSRAMDPVSMITGGRRYSFNIDDSQLVLVQRCHTRGGRHDYVFGSLVTGPNVFLHSTSEQAHSDIGPHHRWSSGALFDNIVTDGQLNIRNRGNMGSGHGWAGADMVVWNSRAASTIIERPEGAFNWAIGVTAEQATGNGAYEFEGARVWPDSLYLRQLAERKGMSAVTAIGYAPEAGH